MTVLDDPDLAAELDTAMRIAGVTIPPERRPAVLAGYADLKGHLALLRAWSGEESPAGAFNPADERE